MSEPKKILNKLLESYLQKYLGPLSSATSLGALCPRSPLAPVWTHSCVTVFSHFRLPFTLIFPRLEERKSTGPHLEIMSFGKEIFKWRLCKYWLFEASLLPWSFSPRRMTWCMVSSLSTLCTRGTSPRRRSPSPRTPPRTRRSSSPCDTRGSCSSLLPRTWLSMMSMVSRVSRPGRGRHHKPPSPCQVPHTGQAPPPHPRSAGPHMPSPWSSPPPHTRRCIGTRAPTRPSTDISSHCSSHSPPAPPDTGRRAQFRYRPLSGPGIHRDMSVMTSLLCVYWDRLNHCNNINLLSNEIH